MTWDPSILLELFPPTPVGTGRSSMTAIDMFAGWGGFSLGAEQAGAEVLWAANHWPLAVQAHSVNLPTAEHLCQDLRQANFHDAPDHDLLLAAPACQGHSQASQPKRRAYHDTLRATAWAVVSAAEAKLPEVIVVENVTDFLRWKLYPVWREALNQLGYTLGEHHLTASHFGVPQRRKRLFIVGSRSKHPLPLRFRRSPEPGFRSCIDETANGWRPVSEATVGVKARVNKGRGNHGDEFLSQWVTGHPGVSLNEPIRTITGAVNHWNLVRGDQYRPLTTRELARGMGFPESYEFPQATKKQLTLGLGNAVCPPVAREVVSQVLACA